MRYLALKYSKTSLVYSIPIVNKIKTEIGANALSFNNTDILLDDFRKPIFTQQSKLKILFVGRFHDRKHLNRLVALAARRSDIEIRLVGPGMEALHVPTELLYSGRVKVFGRCTGKELIPHFDWADLVANPGAVGLLVMNAARHGKGIVIDNSSYHGPEYWLAMEADQPFIDFGDRASLDEFIDRIKHNPQLLVAWANKLQSLAREKYTVENMVQVHMRAFEEVYQEINTWSTCGFNSP